MKSTSHMKSTNQKFNLLLVLLLGFELRAIDDKTKITAAGVTIVAAISFGTYTYRQRTKDQDNDVYIKIKNILESTQTSRIINPFTNKEINLENHNEGFVRMIFSKLTKNKSFSKDTVIKRHTA